MVDYRSSSSSWRHPTAAAWRWAPPSTVDARQLALDVGLSTFVRPGPGPPRRGAAAAGGGGGGALKLERAPTPTRADRLLVGPGDEHAVTLCFPPPPSPRHGWTELTPGVVKMSSDSTAVADSGHVLSWLDDRGRLLPGSQ